ncbi:histidine kinase [Rhodocytophaga aerolata]|uniref:Histidine kinase n=1 Tax=Rhodocytophaga aerolata TaxID=455078 RepID=A0ABT8R6K8_9BACT|nr:histidine kinase [Rhodocytophaga aerolata]MDO1447737.1 histidine kinase [Rhodocytophaga aerolata]
MKFSETRFIFSDEPLYRISRHGVFWVAWWLFFSFLYGTRPIETDSGWYIFKDTIVLSSIEAFLFLPSHIVFSYSIIYLLIPKFLLKGRYWLFMLCLISSTLLAAFISHAITLLAIIPFRESVGLAIPKSNFYYGMMSGLRGGIQTGGFAAAIKLMKYFYLKQKDNQQLLQEKLKAELQLLKSQVHPHFLFNTLNNLYSLTLTKSELAPEIVLKLSGLLRYMLYECNTPRVPLDKEIAMLQNYIELEKLRYGNHLDMSVNIRGEYGHKQIAPLLLLPFIENSFKHGASELLDQAWISLDMFVRADTLKFKLVNSQPEVQVPYTQPINHSAGIGLTNVKKRLDLLYPGLHDLRITSEEGTFIVNLSLQLESLSVVDKAGPVSVLPISKPDENQMPVSR